LLIVGHDPGIPDLAFLLARPTSPAGGGSGIAAPAAFERMRAKFPTAAIAVLELTGTWRQLGPQTARLARFVIPRDVRTGKPPS
jgi:phosphohistidine phosphatase